MGGNFWSGIAAFDRKFQAFWDKVHPYLDPVVSVLIVRIPRFIIGTLIFVGIAINFANVVGRYVFLEPIIWAEEIMIYIMVWTVFIGAVLVSWDGRHLKMDFFSIMLPAPWKQVMNGIATLAFLVVCLFVIPKSFTVTELMFNLSQLSVVAEMPMSVPHSALLIGFVLMLIAVAYRFRSHVMGTLETEVDEIVHEYGEEQTDDK